MDGLSEAPRIVDRAEWLKARRALLAREKALFRLSDEVAAARRALPRLQVEKDYVFEGETGPIRLADLFEGRPQLIVQHFMFGPDWEEGCRSCSMMADHVDGMVPHLAARGVAFVAVSRAPLERLLAFRERLGWRFPWVSSLGSAFNFDFGVSFAPEAVERGEAEYNYRPGPGGHDGEAPGISAFERAPDGGVLHAYSAYERGVEAMMGVYRMLDLAPRGRDEAGLPWPMAWVRHNDSYEAAPTARGCCG